MYARSPAWQMGLMMSLSPAPTVLSLYFHKFLTNLRMQTVLLAPNFQHYQTQGRFQQCEAAKFSLCIFCIIELAPLGRIS